MALFLFTPTGYWETGSLQWHMQIIITSKGKVRKSVYWVSTSPLPGIY